MKKTLLSTLLSLVLITHSSLGFAAEQTNEIQNDPFNSSTLNSQQWESLKGKKLFRDGFSIRVATGTINGVPRTVVLMGESHFKTDKVKARAAEVTDKFDLYGVESIDMSQYWGNAKALDVMLDALGLIFKPFLNGSTVYDVHNKVSEAEQTPEKIKNLKEFIQLEKNYHPDIQDNLSVLLLPLTYSTMILSKCSEMACHKWPQVILLQKLSKVPHTAFRAIMAYLILDVVSRLMFDKDQWQDQVFVLSTGILYHRNQNMSDNIIRAFQERDNKQNILVITGAFHQSGIMSHLVDRYNFQEIKLD
jgi:hypothetical protein